MAAVKGATTNDAIVVASAAQRGDSIFTSDVDDLGRALRTTFEAFGYCTSKGVPPLVRAH